MIDPNIPVRRPDNDYLIDRDMQRHVNMPGLHGLNDQDRCMQEGKGRIVNRQLEFPAGAGRSVMIARRKILEITETPENLAAFRQKTRDGREFGVRPLDVVTEIGDVTAFLEHYRIDLFAN